MRSERMHPNQKKGVFVMGWFEGLKNKNVHDEDEIEEVEEFEDEVEEEAQEEAAEAVEEPAAPAKTVRMDFRPFGNKNAAAAPKTESVKPIIEFNEPRGGNTIMDTYTGERSQILLYKPDSLDGIKRIADRVNEKKTVILNLEGKPEDFIKTVIDFFSGVAYANHGKLSPIADQTYIVTPNNVDMDCPGGANIGDAELGNLNIFESLNNDTF